MAEERAWPFENVPEGGARIRTPRDFVARRQGVDAMVIRIGLNDAQVVLVDEDGSWDRWVFHSEDEAREVAESLEVPVHVGEYPEKVRVRMNARQRPQRDFDRRAYPEEGHIGPAIPYPENRPRRIEGAKEGPPKAS
ncbi:MAG: hypothetical protein ACRDKB_00310 [Actinomycetota bacterium]